MPYCMDIARMSSSLAAFFAARPTFSIAVAKATIDFSSSIAACMESRRKSTTAVTVNVAAMMPPSLVRVSPRLPKPLDAAGASVWSDLRSLIARLMSRSVYSPEMTTEIGLDLPAIKAS